MAAIIDADNRIGFGPAMIGPDAERALTEFLASVEYDVTGVDSSVLRDWFEQWAGGHFQPSEAPAVSPAGSAVESPSGSGLASERLADREAAAGGGAPPPPAPADTDLAPDAGETATVTADAAGQTGGSTGDGTDPPPYTGPCFACGGSGSVALVEGEPPVMCSACRGSGTLPAPVQ